MNLQLVAARSHLAFGGIQYRPGKADTGEGSCAGYALQLNQRATRLLVVDREHVVADRFNTAAITHALRKVLAFN